MGLVRRHHKYYARHRVPPDVAEDFDGKREVWDNLNTSDLRLAEARCHRANADFRARVLEARGRLGTVEDDAFYWRRTIEEHRGSGDPDARDDLSSEAIEAALRFASEKYAKGGWKAVERHARLFHEGSEPEALIELGGPKARAFIDVVLAGKTPLQPFITQWFAQREREVEKSTAFMDRSAVTAFVRAHPLLNDITRPNVAKWIEGRRREVTGATAQREVSGLRSFHHWLRSHGEVPDDTPDPFAGHKFQDRRKKVEEARREAFTPEEADRLYTAALGRPDGDTLAAFVALGAWTGMRREEIAALRIEDLSLGKSASWLTIRRAKTASSNRTIPTHPRAVPLLKRLAGKRTSGFLFADLKADHLGRRGDLTGKAFTYLKKKMGFPASRTFHSLRHMFVQRVRALGTPEDLVGDLVGHKPVSITGARYGSPEARKKLLPEAIAGLSYPGKLRAPK
jgi:integrase